MNILTHLGNFSYAISDKNPQSSWKKKCGKWKYRRDPIILKGTGHKYPEDLEFFNNKKLIVLLSRN